VEEIALTINGIRLSCRPGASILETAEKNGIRIPTLCHHPDLEPFGACRLCLVEDEKSGRVMASCVTPAAPDMEILTDSPRVIRHRKNILRMMIAEHPESCILCSRGNRCRLRQEAARVGIGETGLYPMPNYRGLEMGNPFIVRDLSKCILCGKCIRADHELVVVGAIDYNLRGFRSRPATLHDLPLEHSDCTFCGTCVSICPTGALAVRDHRYVGTPEREEITTCGFCAVGCSLVAGVFDGRVMEMNPAGLEGSVNRSTLCVRGHFAHDFLNSSERLTQPMVRKGDALEPVSWDEALATVAGRLMEIRNDYGPQSIALMGSSKCTNEENYLFQKLARAVLGTNNVDNGGYLTGRPALTVLHDRTDGGCRINPISDLDQAESILVVGADPAHSAPVLGYAIKRAALRGIPLIVVDPRKTELVPHSSLWVRVSPGRDSEWINALAALLWKRFSHDTAFIDRFTEGFGAYTDALSSFNPERLCLSAGTDMACLERAVGLLKGKKITLIVGRGITQQRGGTGTMEALINLSLMTGSMGGASGRIHLIAGDRNETGAWDMGAVPEWLPGRLPLSSAEARKGWERLWKVKLSPDRGLNLFRMVEESDRGNLKALYIMGENPLRALPQADRVSRALGNLDFLVVQDILPNETTRIADVVLPGAAFSEKEGSFTGMEGRLHWFRQVTLPPGEARPDWEILDLLAARMGNGNSHGSLKKIRSEIADNVALYAGIKKEIDSGFTWIRETSSMRLFNPSGEGAMIPFSSPGKVDAWAVDDDFPFTAVLGSHRFHLGSGTRTAHSDRIGASGPGGEVEISPEDGASMDLCNGDMVKVRSREGSLVRKIRFNKGLGAGLILVPTGFHGNKAMTLPGLTPMEDPQWQGLKTCRVKIEKVLAPKEGDTETGAAGPATGDSAGRVAP